MLNRVIKYLIENKIVAFMLLFLFFIWGIYHTPFSLPFEVPQSPVTVDAIPDIGENQQILYTEWVGQSPQDIEDQITYPLTSRLYGIPGVKTIRSSSMFGFSSIYIIFEDEIDYYWSRNRVLEKISSIPQDLLPEGVVPTLGTDATALGQVFWYTLEGRDENGRVTGGWDLHEIRSIQDFYVKNGLSSTPGVSEVASIGGFVQEYQIDIDPEIMRQYNISLAQVVKAVKEGNKDVGAKTLEINSVEYFVRGLGYLESSEDIEDLVVRAGEFTPIYIKDIARVNLGPAERRGILDKGGAEVVGGVVVAQYGANPMEVITNLKQKIKDISIGLPVKELRDGRKSKLTIVPFYDRSELIKETLGTLGRTLSFEILITILVVIILLANIRTSIIISSLMPLVVLMVFIGMKLSSVDANILALSGIAIAIGTVVDMGIILTENIIRHLQLNRNESTDETVYKATTEVSGAIVTAGLTTIVSFIPVFMLSGAEGKLFYPLAFTKTLALSGSMFVALFVIPPLAAVILKPLKISAIWKQIVSICLILVGVYSIYLGTYIGLILVFFGIFRIYAFEKEWDNKEQKKVNLGFVLFFVWLLLSYYWRPLGPEFSFISNSIFVLLAATLVVLPLYFFKKYYSGILRYFLVNKSNFVLLPIALFILGFLLMLNMQKEFMPSLDEGSFLLMPTSMPHAGVTENSEVLKKLDMAVAQLPEVEMVVGKAGRAETPLDPAPLSMFENLIQYKPKYYLDDSGSPLKFEVNDRGLFKTVNGNWVAMGSGIQKKDLVEDKNGSYYRNWRKEINSKEDIWNEIVKVTKFPGITSAPRLQPIETRLVMLQTGMRSAFGIKVQGQDINEIEKFGIALEEILINTKGVKSESVFADRIVGKPYLEIDIDRKKISRYNISINDVQEVLEVAVGGKVLTRTIEGRENYAVRIRYPRELRATPEDIAAIYVDIDSSNKVLLSDLISIDYKRGPQIIKSEDGFLTGYVIFDKEEGISEVTVINAVDRAIDDALKEGSLVIPSGLNYKFSGTHENQLRAEQRLMIVVPLVFLVIFLILYLQFNSVKISLMVFTGIALAFSGGFILLWLYSQSWFLNIDLFGINFRELFHIKTIYLSVAVWVGFIALFGIATDDGVIMATYLKQTFKQRTPKSINEIRAAVVEAGEKRIRPCLMTTATTVLALLPILTSLGKGSDVMLPMAIPILGGMFMALITLVMVPLLYCWQEEVYFKRENYGKV